MKRRKERAEDVVIGKTSAITDASDYKFDVSSTEEQWMRQASKVEREVFKQTERGMECLRMFQLQVNIVEFWFISPHEMVSRETLTLLFLYLSVKKPQKLLTECLSSALPRIFGRLE